MRNTLLIEESPATNRVGGLTIIKFLDYCNTKEQK